MIIIAGLDCRQASHLVESFQPIENDVLDSEYSDFATEEMPMILWKIFQDDFELYKKIAENQKLNIWLRMAALEGIINNVLNNIFTREKAIDYFRHLLANGPDMSIDCITPVVNSAFDIYPMELMEEIKSKFQEGLVDPAGTSYREFEEALDTPIESHLDTI